MNTETPIAIEVNCETGVETVRPLTAEEIAQAQARVLPWQNTRHLF